MPIISNPYWRYLVAILKATGLTYKGTSSAISANAAYSVTGTYPTGWMIGDLIVVRWALQDQPMPIPEGWNVFYANTTVSPYSLILYRIVKEGDIGVEIFYSQWNHESGVSIDCWSGASEDALENISAYSQGGYNSVFAIPPVIASERNSAVVAWGMPQYFDAASGPTGYSLLDNLGNTLQPIVGYYKMLTSAGLNGGGNITLIGNDGGNFGQFVIKPKPTLAFPTLIVDATNSITSGLSNFWDMSRGDVFDLVGGANGVLGTGVSIVSSPYGNALSFNDPIGATNGVKVGTASGFANSSTNVFSFFCYVFAPTFTSTTANPPLIGSDNTGVLEIRLGAQYGTGPLGFLDVLSEGVSNILESNAYLTQNGWSSVAATCDGTTLSIYINGVLSSTATGLTAGWFARNAQMYLGVAPGVGDYMAPGFKIAVPALWTRTLSATEVTSLHTNPLQLIVKKITLNKGNVIQGWDVPADWNNANNIVECYSAGGSGAYGYETGAGAGGGGGYAKISNITLTPGTNIPIQVGEPGTTLVLSSGSGVDGGATWFNGETLAISSVGIEGGHSGIYNPTTKVGTIGLGASSVNAIGSVINGGGDGNTSAGGGAGGPTGAGTSASTGGLGGGGLAGNGATALLRATQYGGGGASAKRMSFIGNVTSLWTYNATTSATGNIAYPVGILPDDVIFIIGYGRLDKTSIASSDPITPLWEAATDGASQNNGNQNGWLDTGYNTIVFYRIITGTEGPTTTITNTGSPSYNDTSFLMFAVRGADPTNPGESFTPGNLRYGDTSTYPAVTATLPNSLWILSSGVMAGMMPYVTQPVNSVHMTDYTVPAGGNFPGDVLTLSYLSLPYAGTTSNTLPVVASSSNGYTISGGFVIRPAPGYYAESFDGAPGIIEITYQPKITDIISNYIIQKTGSLAQSSGGVDVTITNTVKGNSLLIVLLAPNMSGTVSCSDTNAKYLTSYVNASGGNTMEVWYLNNIPGGTYSVSITPTGYFNSAYAELYETVPLAFNPFLSDKTAQFTPTQGSDTFALSLTSLPQDALCISAFIQGTSAYSNATANLTSSWTTDFQTLNAASTYAYAVLASADINPGTAINPTITATNWSGSTNTLDALIFAVAIADSNSPRVTKIDTWSVQGSSATYGSSPSLASPAINVPEGALITTACSVGNGAIPIITDTAGNKYNVLHCTTPGVNDTYIAWCTSANANAANVVTWSATGTNIVGNNGGVYTTTNGSWIYDTSTVSELNVGNGGTLNQTINTSGIGIIVGHFFEYYTGAFYPWVLTGLSLESQLPGTTGSGGNGAVGNAFGDYLTSGAITNFTTTITDGTSSLTGGKVTGALISFIVEPDYITEKTTAVLSGTL